MDASPGKNAYVAERRFEEAMGWFVSRFKPHQLDDAFKQKVREDCYLAAEELATIGGYSKLSHPGPSAATVKHEASHNINSIAKPSVNLTTSSSHPRQGLQDITNTQVAGRRTHAVPRPPRSVYADMNHNVWKAIATRHHEEVVDVAAIQTEVEERLGEQLKTYYARVEQVKGKAEGSRRYVQKTLWKMKRQGYLTEENKFTESGIMKLEALGYGIGLQ